MNKLDALVQKIDTKFHPISIFLYGSRARGDYNKKSDFEIGMIFDDNNYHHRSELQKFCPKRYNIFPFKMSEFLTGEPDVPFEREIFLKELFFSAKTLFGTNIQSLIKPQSISLLNLIEETRFLMGRALSAITTYRDYDKKTASHLFYKSCLFSTRVLEIHSLKQFPLKYSDIFKFSRKLKIKSEFKKLIAVAFSHRQKGELHEKDLYTNISYINYILKVLKLSNRRFGSKKDI